MGLSEWVLPIGSRKMFLIDMFHFLWKHIQCSSLNWKTVLVVTRGVTVALAVALHLGPFIKLKYSHKVSLRETKYWPVEILY